MDINLNPYPGYFLNRTLYPKAILTSLFLGLDYFVKGEWKKAAGSIGNIHLILQKRNSGWLRYLKFKEDWERAMGEIQRGGMDGILERCWI